MRHKQQLVPLGTLIGRELRNDKLENPAVKYGQAALAKKGEDYFLIKLDCQRVPGDTSTSFSVFAVCVNFQLFEIYIWFITVPLMCFLNFYFFVDF